MVEKHIDPATFIGFQAAVGLRPGEKLKETSVQELKAFLNLPEAFDAIRNRCEGATQEILAEWRDQKISPSDSKAVLRFYQQTGLYCYELIGLEYQFGDHRARQFYEIAEVIKKIIKKSLPNPQSPIRGCDFGSGVGTLGIYLNRLGLPCDFADVSALNLSFIGERLKSRGIQGVQTILLDGELSNRALQNDRYDFITAFDVLEHAVNPRELLRSMISKIKVGGLLIFNLLYDNEEGTPHLLRDPNLIRTEIRGMGMAKVGSIGEFKVYQKRDRWAITNSLLRSLDKAFWFMKGRLKRNKS